MNGQHWQVVGGGDAGGILVRSGLSLQSPLCSQRLATAAVVEETWLQDGRLQYRLVSGSGPEDGWVSVRIGSKDLLVRIGTSYSRSERYSRRVLSELTVHERRSIQLALLEEYSKLSFQQELHNAWRTAGGDGEKQAKMRWAICWDIQAPIFKLHRFAGSQHDALQNNACLPGESASSQVVVEASEVEAGAWLMWLIHPPAQLMHLNGPPYGASASEMLRASVPGLSSTVPKLKVLAKAPCQHVVQDVSYSLRVVGAMNGELLCSADVVPSDRLCDLKRFIFKLEGTPVGEQKLLLNGHLLQCDSDDVADLYEQHCLHSVDVDSGNFQENSIATAASRCLTLALVRLTAERATLLKDLERGLLSLSDVHEELRGESECVLAAIKRNSSALQCAPQSLQSSRAFLLTASKVKGGILQYVPEWAQGDKEIVLAAVRLEGQVLKYASEAMRRDYEVVRAAVDNNGLALQFASDPLRANADIVLGAVENAGASLEHALDALKGDPRIALVALKQNREDALRHVARELLQSYSFGAALEDQGMLEDTFFDGLFWTTVDVAKSYFDQKEVRFLDSRPSTDFQLSHLEGAFSVPITTEWISFEQSEAYNAIVASEDCPIVCYSDTGNPASRCALLQAMLRLSGKVRKYRILRLQGGLNAWKSCGHPVTGDKRLMWRGMPMAGQNIEVALRIRP